MKFITKQCLLCGEAENPDLLYPRTFKDEDLTPAVFSARRTTEHFHYAIVRCRTCGLVFSREILADEELARLYGESIVTFNEFTDVIRRDYWNCFAPFAGTIGRGAAVEIGCSNGFFLDELAARGFQSVRGVEPSLPAIAMASPAVRNGIVAGLFCDGMFPADSFDLVCSFQTLDHLSDPAAVLQSCMTVLKPGGLLYVITHNTESLQARLLGERSPIIDVEHIYLYNKNTLSALLTRHGYAIEGVVDVRNSYPVDYWLRMFPMPDGVRRVLRAAGSATGLGRWAPALRAGNIAAIARKPR
jgi:SAM-dependent methyltransferase